MSTSFDAFVDSLLETDVAVVEAAPNKRTELVTYPCGQCGGTGRYMGARVHQEKSHCFACRGLGFFKSSPEARLKHRRNAAARAKNKLEVGLAAFAENQPLMFADLLAVHRAETNGNSFLYSLAHQLFTKGSLSDQQVGAWHRGKARLEEIRAARLAEEASRKVEAVDLTPIRIMFDKASESGLKKPAYRAEGLVLKAAPAHGRNSGALYVTDAETGEYRGKLVGTTFHPVREAPATVAISLLAIAADPKEAAVRWGRRTGSCSCCGRLLTDKVSVALGIGPICITKWGL